MSELLPSLVPLDKGLNLQTAKLVAPPGSVLDSLNYEQVDFQGQKRIDGFVRYDGNLLSTIDEYYVVELDAAAPALNSIVYNDDDLLGRVVAADGNTMHVAVINENVIPVEGDAIQRWTSGGLVAVGTVEDVSSGVDSGATVDEHYENLLAYNAILRAPTEELPGAIIGLHWFRDRLYAVADVTTVSLVGTTPVIRPNDMLAVDGGTPVKVLDSIMLANTRVVFLATMDPEAWAVEDAEVTRDGDPVGTIANGFEPLTGPQETASFFESRTEAQTIEEDGPSGPYDFGWRFIDLGWTVNFEDGLSLFGSLPSLNQNIVGLGVQGPTDISGDHGRPLLLTQKVDISGAAEQVNGWKSSQTPTTYELETDNLIDIDGDTIYADAYMSWNGTTGEVVGYVEPLAENPAANTVIIELL